MENISNEKLQQKYARVAGFMYLFLIFTFMVGEFIISNIVGSGSFSETAKKIIASEHLYRIALSIEGLSSVSAVLLVFSLYVTLKPVNSNLAQIAMYWRLGESFLGGILWMFSVITLYLYCRPEKLGSFEEDELQFMVNLSKQAHDILFNISTAFFSIGSTIFFYLFLKSKYIPKVISVFGIFASVLVTVVSFANLIFPGYAFIQYGWIPIFIAETTTGFWLLFRGIKLSDQ